jgi:UDP-N-acetylglucosamine acyltransferase
MLIHPSAWVHPDAQVHPTVTIGPNAVVEAGVVIGPDTTLAPSVVLLWQTRIGARCRIHAHAVIGDLPQDRAYKQEQTSCLIGDDCLIREGVTVHRSTGDETSTVIGNRCFLMTNSHVGHNCVLADDVTLVSGALLGGHVTVGTRAIISGNAAVHQFVRIGEYAIVGGVAKVTQDIPPYLMTDQFGEIVGLNTVGLVRAGIPSEARRELKQLHRLMYRSQSSQKQTLEQMTALATSPQGLCFLEFVSGATSRGFRKGRGGSASSVPKRDTPDAAVVSE